MPKTALALFAAMAAFLTGLAPAAAQTSPPQTPPADAPVVSACYAFAKAPSPPIRLARFAPGLAKEEVGLTYVGHSTFLIETAEGVAAATDFSGYAGPGVTLTS